MLNNRYNVIDKLGHGTFSTIWLSRDEQKAACVAVKVSAGDDPIHEAKILRMLTDCCLAHTNGRPLIPVILDAFEIEGPNGHHQCIVTKRLMFQLSNLLWLLHMSMLKAMSMEGNRANDIPPDEAQLLSDFGESFSPSDHEQLRRGQNVPRRFQSYRLKPTLNPTTSFIPLGHLESCMCHVFYIWPAVAVRCHTRRSA
ncbi:hypothetical protein AnigIFM62618_004391 [Aspergillus niger]|nr:hypothetical protein AnigIFM62618_004391 [Aspergillus niger]